jgi:hypothetical protein
MALIADLCPNCGRVTRCHVAERGSVVGGLILGIPFVLPSSSVSCCCGECGYEFKSQTWDYRKALPPGEAMSLDIEAILSLTNPTLKEQVALLRLKAAPELGGAFHLLEQLKPGSLRTALKDALVQWPVLDEGQREHLLADVRGCAEALRFAHVMAGRSTTGIVGCLGGTLGCAGVWWGCIVAFGTELSLWGVARGRRRRGDGRVAPEWPALVRKGPALAQSRSDPRSRPSRDPPRLVVGRTRRQRPLEGGRRRADLLTATCAGDTGRAGCIG